VKESPVIHTARVFAWWFIVGATMALAVILLQGGIREALQAQGLLGGCIALILDRIKKA